MLQKQLCVRSSLARVTSLKLDYYVEEYRYYMSVPTTTLKIFVVFSIIVLVMLLLQVMIAHRIVFEASSLFLSVEKQEG